jgi:hypothetical protein
MNKIGNAKKEFYLFLFLVLLFTIFVYKYWDALMVSHFQTKVSGQWMNFTYVVLTLYSVYIYLAHIGGRRIKGIHIVCLLWILIMLFVNFFNSSSMMDYFVTITWPLLFEATYLFGTLMKMKDMECNMRRLFIFIAIYGTCLFFLSRQDFSHQTNTIFFALLPLPFLLLTSNRRQYVILMIVFSLFALLSLKRSAMMTLAFSWCFYFLYLMKQKKSMVISFALLSFMALTLLSSLEMVNQQLGGVVFERINQDEMDGEGGRLAIWDLTFSMIKQSSASNLLFGHGHNSVIRDSYLQISAHNDFLEVVYDYGLIIFILYLALWIHVIRRCFYLYKKRSNLFLPYSVSLSIFLSMSLVSHLILYASYFNILVMFWAMIEAMTLKGYLHSFDKKQGENKNLRVNMNMTKTMFP